MPSKKKTTEIWDIVPKGWRVSTGSQIFQKAQMGQSRPVFLEHTLHIHIDGGHLPYEPPPPDKPKNAYVINVLLQRSGLLLC